jgi:UDP-N-acetylmuramoyl-tripeptide--D-alanyl-D-alanine ligase
VRIAYLAEVARPHIGVITNVGAAHLERLHSLADIARAKGELFAGLGPDGWAILPGDRSADHGAGRARSPDRRLTFGGRSAGDDPRAGGFPAGAQGAVVRYVSVDVP